MYQRFWHRLALGVGVLDVEEIEQTEFVAIVMNSGQQNGILMFRAGKWGLSKVEFEDPKKLKQWKESPEGKKELEKGFVESLEI